MLLLIESIYYKIRKMSIYFFICFYFFYMILPPFWITIVYFIVFAVRFPLRFPIAFLAAINPVGWRIEVFTTHGALFCFKGIRKPLFSTLVPFCVLQPFSFKSARLTANLISIAGLKFSPTNCTYSNFHVPSPIVHTFRIFRLFLT